MSFYKNLTSEDIIEAKNVFETYSTTMGIKIQHHHINNGSFADNMCMKDIQESN